MEELEALAEEEQDDSSTASSEYIVQSRSYAFIAASSIVAAAYTNRSLTGTVSKRESPGDSLTRKSGANLPASGFQEICKTSCPASSKQNTLSYFAVL